MVCCSIIHSIYLMSCLFYCHLRDQSWSWLHQICQVTFHPFNSLWSCDAIWWHKSGSALGRVMMKLVMRKQVFTKFGVKRSFKGMSYMATTLMAPSEYKDCLSSYENFHYKDNMIMRLSHLYNENSYLIRWHLYMGQVTKSWLTCYLVLLSTDSKTR